MKLSQIISPAKFRALASYLSIKEKGLAGKGSTEVQNDLRKFANALEEMEVEEKEKQLADADKALAILKAFHEIAHNSEKNEGLTITKDWDLNTLTIETKEGHGHFGQMNHEDDGFPILINEMYNHFCKTK